MHYIISTVVNINASVDVVTTGQDHALLKVTIQWSSPCPTTMLDTPLTYTDDNALNGTLLIQYSCTMEVMDEIVIRDLAADTVYYYTLHIHQGNITGSFRTLNITDTATTTITSQSSATGKDITYTPHRYHI